MDQYHLYQSVCSECSRLITNRYSTSFSMGIKVFAKRFRMPVYAIYGFVRFADEIVDTFHQHDKADLLERFRSETYRAIEERISLNPVLQAFQETVNHFGIEHELIEAFLESMAMDLYFHTYEDSLYKKYIYGSAEVVGLMCLRVFCHDQPGMYEELRPSACALGSAFQKINFLRDMKSDFAERGRVYFPGIDFTRFDDEAKREIEADIKRDFDHAYTGIVRLPHGARFGVYLAYKYYLSLFYKIRNAPAKTVSESRIRVADSRKMLILAKSALRASVNMM